MTREESRLSAALHISFLPHPIPSLILSCSASLLLFPALILCAHTEALTNQIFVENPAFFPRVKLHRIPGVQMPRNRFYLESPLSVPEILSCKQSTATTLFLRTREETDIRYKTPSQQRQDHISAPSITNFTLPDAFVTA